MAPRFATGFRTEFWIGATVYQEEKPFPSLTETQASPAAAAKANVAYLPMMSGTRAVGSLVCPPPGIQFRRSHTIGIGRRQPLTNVQAGSSVRTQGFSLKGDSTPACGSGRAGFVWDSRWYSWFEVWRDSSPWSSHGASNRARNAKGSEGQKGDTYQGRPTTEPVQWERVGVI
jgi:hypothetical protein